jgi:hypothetical protein
VKFLVVLSLFFFALPAVAQFEGTYELSVKKKQEEKKRARWTLAEWLEQKDRNRMMDLWLARNSTSSPYEFLFGLKSLSLSVDPGQGQPKTNENTYGGEVGAYAGVIGLRGSYEQDSARRKIWSGSLNLRLFGRQIQGTHINLGYGFEGLSGDATGDRFQTQFGAVSSNIYLTKYFGLSGEYRRLFSSQSEHDHSLRGERSHAGVFIDFGALRIFGEWRKEVLHIKDPAGVPSGESRDGFGGGVLFFF